MSPIKVSAAVLIKDDLIFCARRAAHKSMAGLWEFPGGKVERDESASEGLVRELREEFGIETQVIRRLMETTHQYDHQSITLIAFHVVHISGDFICTDHDAIQWLPRHKLIKLTWSAADIPIVMALVNGTIGRDCPNLG